MMNGITQSRMNDVHLACDTLGNYLKSVFDVPCDFIPGIIPMNDDFVVSVGDIVRKKALGARWCNCTKR